jgi:hypothetical protein
MLQQISQIMANRYKISIIALKFIIFGLKSLHHLIRIFMISHALSILINELNKHFHDVYNIPVSKEAAIAGNVSEINHSSEKDEEKFINKIIFTVINILEERSGSSFPGFSKGEATGGHVLKESQSAMNLAILIAANHSDYNEALLMISRTIRHFRTMGMLTSETVAPESLTINAPENPKDRLKDFKLSVTMHSCSFEEINLLRNITGGKQYPFVIYNMRLN